MGVQDWHVVRTHPRHYGEVAGYESRFAADMLTDAVTTGDMDALSIGACCLLSAAVAVVTAGRYHMTSVPRGDAPAP